MNTLTASVLRFVLLAAVVLTAVPAGMLTGGSNPAHACSCVASGGAADARDAADAVFAGEVTFVDPPPSAGGGWSSATAVRVSFAVSEVWKGPATPEVHVVTAGDSASCGYEFTPGYSYLVYAYQRDGVLEASLCSRTAPLADANGDLTALGSGTRVTQQPEAVDAAVASPADGGGSLEDPIVVVLVVAGVVALGIGASVVWRFRRA